MNTNRMTVYSVLTLSILAASLPAMAETGGPAATPRREFQRERGRGRDADRGQRSLERFMERLRDEEPEEFERLQRLREKDHSEFRSELRERLANKRKRLYGHRRGGKASRDAGMPNRNRGFGDKPPNAIRRPMPNGEPSEFAELRKSIGKQASRFRRAEGDEKTRIASELKADLGRMFDVRQEGRLETVKRLEAKIGELKRIIAERENEREKIIDRQFQRITSPRGRGNRSRE